MATNDITSLSSSETIVTLSVAEVPDVINISVLEDKTVIVLDGNQQENLIIQEETIVLLETPFVPVIQNSGIEFRRKIGIVPFGIIDGVNTVFTAPTYFIHDGSLNEAVYLRGLRRLEGVGCEYVAFESGGFGTGYDTVVFTEAPLEGDAIYLDYYTT